MTLVMRIPIPHGHSAAVDFATKLSESFEGADLYASAEAVQFTDGPAVDIHMENYDRRDWTPDRNEIKRICEMVAENYPR